MTVREDEVKVHIGRSIFDSHEHRQMFENDLDRLFSYYSMNRWASGKDMITEVRDIAYEKNVSNEGPEEEK